MLGATAIDPVTNQELGALTQGRIIYTTELNNGQLTARAEPGAMVGSVHFELTGPHQHTRTESVAPYALHGDNNGNYSGSTFPVGNYTLRMIPYQNANRGGLEGDHLVINFSVANPPTSVSYTLATQTNGQGSITVSPLKASYAPGETVSLTAVPASGWAFSGWSGNASGTTNPVTLTMDANKSVTAQFISTSTAQKVTHFTLINPVTELEVGLLTQGQVIDVSQFPQQQINVRAYTSPDPVGSVVFRATGPTNVTRTETAPPYALFGDRDGIDYFGGNLSPGSYTLTATPYTLAGGKGTAGDPLTISFTVVNGANARMTADPETGQEATAGIGEASLSATVGAVSTQQWQVYPNPFTDQLNIFTGQPGKLEWQLFQQTGACLYRGTHNPELPLDLRYEQLPLGVYWLHILSGQGEKRVFKLVKQ